MPAVHRLGDYNEDDADVYDIAQGTVYANGLLVSIDGSKVEGHDTGEHSDPETANGSPTVFINSIPVNRQGDPDTCGCPRDGGSPDVFVGDGGVGASGSNASTASALDSGSSDITSGNFVPSWAGPGGISPFTAFDKISPGLLAIAALNMTDTIITKIIDAGLINENSKLPFGGDDSGAGVATASLENLNESSAPTALRSSTPIALSEATVAAVNVWYTQQVTKSINDAGLSNKWPNLPFGGNKANG